MKLLLKSLVICIVIKFSYNFETSPNTKNFISKNIELMPAQTSQMNGNKFSHAFARNYYLSESSQEDFPTFQNSFNGNLNRQNHFQPSYSYFYNSNDGVNLKGGYESEESTLDDVFDDDLDNINNDNEVKADIRPKFSTESQPNNIKLQNKTEFNTYNINGEQNQDYFRKAIGDKDLKSSLKGYVLDENASEKCPKRKVVLVPVPQKCDHHSSKGYQHWPSETFTTTSTTTTMPPTMKPGIEGLFENNGKNLDMDKMKQIAKMIEMLETMD